MIHIAAKCLKGRCSFKPSVDESVETAACYSASHVGFSHLCQEHDLRPLTCQLLTQRLKEVK